MLQPIQYAHVPALSCGATWQKPKCGILGMGLSPQSQLTDLWLTGFCLVAGDFFTLSLSKQAIS